MAWRSCKKYMSIFLPCFINLLYHDFFTFSIDILLDLIDWCVSKNIFQFEDSCFWLKYDMVMRSSLYPILSSLFIRYFKFDLISQILNLKWLRYLNYILIIHYNISFKDFFNDLKKEYIIKCLCPVIGEIKRNRTEGWEDK